MTEIVTEELVEETTNSQEYTKIPRAELVELLVMRDGEICMHPDCGLPLQSDAPAEDKMSTTIDHWMPQYWCKANGWTMGQIWALDNLKLMHKKCNAHKGDLIPNDDGTLPKKVTREWKNRRAKRVNRPEICEKCNAGRSLQEDEWCNACGSGPQPARYPKWRQEAVRNCDHDLFFCVACTVWEPELRRSALDALLTGGNGYE